MKMKILMTAFLIVISLAGMAQKVISYDGYYVSVPDSNAFSLFRYYLRFYPDGTVIGVNTAGQPGNLIHWFNKENKTPYTGKYAIADSILRFSMKSEQGEVAYTGWITGENKLQLTVKSMINKYEGREEYNFMKMEKIK